LDFDGVQPDVTGPFAEIEREVSGAIGSRGSKIKYVLLPTGGD
jgi:hypothetical protein